MPWSNTRRYKWVRPAVFMKTCGVTIYHTYRNGDITDVKRDYWFTTCEKCGEVEFCDQPENHRFDVRTLLTYKETEWNGLLAKPYNAQRRIDELTLTKATIQEAIKTGELKAPKMLKKT